MLLKFRGFILAVSKVVSGVPDSQMCCCLKELCSRSARDLPRTSTPPPPPLISLKLCFEFIILYHTNGQNPLLVLLYHYAKMKESLI